MKLIPLLLKEMEQEGKTTRTMLERIPDDKYDFKVHPKSMSIQQLAVHIAELPTWVPLAINTEELDFAVNEYKLESINNTKDLLAYFDKNLADGLKQLATANEDQIINGRWVLRTGDMIHVDDTKYQMIRVSISQTIHHRAQLGVNLRLLNIPLPESYGPTADTQSFM